MVLYMCIIKKKFRLQFEDWTPPGLVMNKLGLRKHAEEAAKLAK